MGITSWLSSARGRVVTASAVVTLTGVATLAGTSGVADASAASCQDYTAGGSICLATSGSGDHLSGMEASWSQVFPPYEICNYSAWFYYVPPTGGAYGLSYQKRSGCGLGRVWLNDYTNRSFPNRTLVCGKFYSNNGDYDGTVCIRLTK